MSKKLNMCNSKRNNSKKNNQEEMLKHSWFPVLIYDSTHFTSSTPKHS